MNSRQILILILLLILPTLQACAARDLLRPEQAFTLHIEAVSQHVLLAHWEIERGYYLYHDKLDFKIAEPSSATIERIRLLPGVMIEDEFFGRTEIHRQSTRALIELKHEDITTQDIEIIGYYQGCADAGVCYPPLTQQVKVIKTASLPTEFDVDTFWNQASSQALPSEQDRLAATLASGTLAWTMLAFFGLGLLLTFTPCVLPMIPILSNIIMGEKELTAKRGFFISLSFVLAMALTYTALGVAAGLAGASLHLALQNPWVIGAFVGILVALALSMFGFYELSLPSRLQTKLAQISGRQSSGTLLGAAIMGFLAALLVGPCTTAPLLGALLYISQTGDALLGGLALFAMSLGMGLPLLIIGTSAGKLLPKAGPWMEAIKAVFGVLILGLCIWLLERILPASITMLLWAILLIVVAVYMGALQSLPAGTRGVRVLYKGIGVVLLIYGILLMVGAASGGKDILRPLASLDVVTTSVATTDATTTLTFERATSLDELDAHLHSAREQGKPVVVDFYANWCVDCVRMQRTTFADARIIDALAGVYLIKADVTEQGSHERTLMQHFNLFGPPALIFYDARGQEMPHLRLVGYINTQRLERHLQIAFQ